MSDTFGSGQAGNPSLYTWSRRRGYRAARGRRVRHLPLRVGDNVTDYVLVSPGARLHCVEYQGGLIAVCTSESLSGAQQEGRRISLNHQNERNR